MEVDLRLYPGDGLGTIDHLSGDFFALAGRQ